MYRISYVTSALLGSLILVVAACTSPATENDQKPNLTHTSSTRRPTQPTPLYSERPTTLECAASFLELDPSQITLLQGKVIASYYVKNTGAKPCWVGGYPRVQLRNAQNKLILLSYKNGGGEFSDPSSATQHFLLRHSYGVGFNIQADAVGATCWKAMSISISKPPTDGQIGARTTSDDMGVRACGNKVLIAAFFAPVAPMP